MTVAILSVITTESVSNPDCLPSGEDSRIWTRLGWLARVIWLVIMATTTCPNPVFRLSACITSAGRVLAVRRLELGNRTRTTSPRLQTGFGGVIVVIHVHFRCIPVFKSSQTPTQFRGLGLIYSIRP